MNEEVAFIVVGATELFKRYCGAKYCELFAVMIGVVVCVAISARDGEDLLAGGIRGCIIGLTVTGLYKSAKNFVKK